MNNGDAVRAMTNEQLADILSERAAPWWCPPSEKPKLCSGLPQKVVCLSCWHAWLMQPTKEA